MTTWEGVGLWLLICWIIACWMDIRKRQKESVPSTLFFGTLAALVLLVALPVSFFEKLLRWLEDKK